MDQSIGYLFSPTHKKSLHATESFFLQFEILFASSPFQLNYLTRHAKKKFSFALGWMSNIMYIVLSVLQYFRDVPGVRA